MTLPTISYIVYLCVMTAVTIGVGSRLFQHGKPFLLDVFQGDARTAHHVNTLLLVGFYLTNFALVLLFIRICQPITTFLDAVHFVVGRVGTVLIILGVMHFGNVAVLSFARRVLLNTQHS